MQNAALNALRYHVTGAIERGEKQAVVECTAHEVSIAEYDALCLSLDKTRLRKRINEAKSVLHLRYRKMFKPGIFKPAEKALYSDSPFGYKLQWQTRRNPAEPESYGNQQTSVGVVYLEELGKPE